MVDVRREKIGTGGCAAKSAALRGVVKQSSRGRCCVRTQPLSNPPMGNRQTEGFRHLDEIRYGGGQYWVSGRRTNGSFKVVGFGGESIKDGSNWKKLVRIRSVGTMLTKRFEVRYEDLESKARAFGINKTKTQTKESVR